MNFTSQMTHKSGVLGHSCNILFGDPIWSDLDLYLVWYQYLYANFFIALQSLFAKLGFPAIINTVSVAIKAKSDDFDFWPDIDLTYFLLKMFLFLFEVII